MNRRELLKSAVSGALAVVGANALASVPSDRAPRLFRCVSMVTGWTTEDCTGHRDHYDSDALMRIGVLTTTQLQESRNKRVALIRNYDEDDVVGSVVGIFVSHDQVPTSWVHGPDGPPQPVYETVSTRVELLVESDQDLSGLYVGPLVVLEGREITEETPVERIIAVDAWSVHDTTKFIGDGLQLSEVESLEEFACLELSPI